MLIYFHSGYKADRIFFVSIANGVLFEFEARQIVSEFLSNRTIVIRAQQQRQCTECRHKKKKKKHKKNNFVCFDLESPFPSHFSALISQHFRFLKHLFPSLFHII